MSVRRIFLLLAGPLFLLLAGVNAALLYGWEGRAAREGLERQAVAAAVTAAAFVETEPDLAAQLATPVRQAALRRAASHIPGLAAVELFDGEGRSVRLLGAPVDVPGLVRPEAAVALLDVGGRLGARRITGLAPLSRGGFVAAQIDAEPLYAEVGQLQRLLAATVVLVGLVGLALALFTARRVTRELARAGAMIAAIRTDELSEAPERFRIRETRDLADAVRLMRTSVTARMARGRRELERRDRARDEAGAAQAQQAANFPAVNLEAAGARVAVRALGRTGPGAFYALAVGEDRAALALGECVGDEPATALAQALAASRHLTASLLEGDPQDRIAEAQAAFGVARIVWTAWSLASPPPRLLGLCDPEAIQRAEAYAAQAASLSPSELLDDLAVLVGGDGLVAALQSGQGGER